MAVAFPAPTAAPTPQQLVAACSPQNLSSCNWTCGAISAQEKTTSRTSSCGSQRVFFFKLHKVGSTTAANVVESYQRRNELTLCPKTVSLMTLSACDVINTHDGSWWFVAKHGLNAWLNLGWPVRPKAVTTILLRDPVERLLSRFFYDNYAKRPNQEFGGNWSKVWSWLTTLPSRETRYYQTSLVKDCSTPHCWSMAVNHLMCEYVQMSSIPQLSFQFSSDTRCKSN